jgi:hypothetical protein
MKRVKYINKDEMELTESPATGERVSDKSHLGL